MNRKSVDYPEVREVVLIVVDEKNLTEWRKAKVVRHV